MVVDCNYTHYEEHCVMYRGIQSLCCTTETKIILYVNYPSVRNLKPVILQVLSTRAKDLLKSLMRGQLLDRARSKETQKQLSGDCSKTNAGVRLQN